MMQVKVMVAAAASLAGGERQRSGGLAQLPEHLPNHRIGSTHAPLGPCTVLLMCMPAYVPEVMYCAT